MTEAPAAAAALTGIRVLDLTTNYAAYAGRLLADLGADVVRVEPPEGSPVRSLAPSQPGRMGEVLSFAHAFLDAGKRSVTLDRATPAGRELLVELAASSDAIIETPAAAGDERIDVERIRQRNPGLVLVSISAFGRDGPYAGYRATDLTLLAAGGLLSLGGYADSEPLAVQGEQAMLASGIYGAIAVLTGLYQRMLYQRGLLDRCVRAGMRGVRARRRRGGVVDQWPCAPPPRRRRTRGRHRCLSLQGRLRQHGGGPPRHRQGVRRLDAVGRGFRGAGRCVLARAALAGLQLPPVGGGDRAVRRDLRCVLPHARQAGALSRRSGPPDRDCAGEHHRRRPAGPPACGEFVFPAAARTHIRQGYRFSRTALSAQPHACAATRSSAAARRAQSRAAAGGVPTSPPARRRLEKTRCSFRV